MNGALAPSQRSGPQDVVAQTWHPSTFKHKEGQEFKVIVGHILSLSSA